MHKGADGTGVDNLLVGRGPRIGEVNVGVAQSKIEKCHDCISLQLFRSCSPQQSDKGGDGAGSDDPGQANFIAGEGDKRTRGG